MSVSMYEMTSAEVAEAIARRPLAVIPFGSVEQHGPHLPCGTDTMASELIARAVAEQLEGIHVPFAPYGVTPIHAGHPGTISLRRETFEALVRDVCLELAEMGVRTLVLVNWHEVNTASLDAVAADLQAQTSALFLVAQACYVAQRLYAEEGGELTHGGSIETMAAIAYDPSLVKTERAREADRPPRAEMMDAMRRSNEVYGFVTDVTEIAETGWYGDPMWANEERVSNFVERVSDDIVRQVSQVLQLRGGES
jgi:creatinine amidohydrolase